MKRRNTRRSSKQLEQVVMKVKNEIEATGDKVQDVCKKYNLEPSLYYTKKRQYESNNNQFKVSESHQNINKIQAKLLELEKENYKLKEKLLKLVLAS